MATKLKVICILLALALIPLAAVRPTTAAEDAAFKVAFLMADSPSDQGWNAAHYRGISKLKELGDVTATNGLSFTVKLRSGKTLDVQVVENIGYNDAEIERAARRVLADGANYVFGTWFDSMGAMSRLAEEFPKVLFEHASGYPLVKANGKNFSTYFIRIEQGDYVAGYITGLQGRSDIGIVATYPIPEPVRGVNGFTLGLQRGLKEAGKDPASAKVQLIWITSWLDREKETQAAHALLDQGFKIIRQMADTPFSSQTTCEAKDTVAIGYGTDVSKVARCALVTNEWNWGQYYVSHIQAALDGKFKSEDWWGGFPEGAVTMNGWNDKLIAPEIRKKADSLVKDITDKKFNPFCGPISGAGKNKDGSMAQISVPEGKCLSDMDQLSMQWLVNGVKGEYPPAPDAGFKLELVDAAK